MKVFFQRIFANKKSRWIAAIILVLVLAGAGAVGYASQNAVPASVRSASAQAYPVSRGDLTATITGTGKLISENTDSLSFSTEGIVEVLNVKVGQMVKKGDILAGLTDTEKLSLSVENKELALRQAEQAIQDLKDGAAAALAQAKADQAAAGEAYTKANADLIKKGQPRCDHATTEQYYYDYMYARHDYNLWNSYLVDGGTGYGTMYIQQRMAPYKKAMQINYANWKYCEGYTDVEKHQSEADLELAKANLDKATAAYEELVKNEGIDPLQMSVLEARKNDAERALKEAQENLADATLVAPFDGVITAVNGTVGLKFEKGTFIEIADLNHEVVQTSVEETDAASFKAGCPAAVVFTTHKDQTYTGTVTRVDPSLVSDFDTQVVRGWVKLTDELPQTIKNYSLGLDASVTITCVKASDALLVPTGAIHRSGGAAYVYVRDAQTGDPAKREIQIGQTTSAFAEVTGGLQEGELVVIEQESNS